MEVINGQASVDQLDATDFNDAITGARIQACRFGIKNNLSHALSVFKRVKKRPQVSCRH